MVEDGGIDEKSKLNAHYISTSESCWRIFRFGTNDHDPSIHLHVHIPLQNNVNFGDDDNVQDVVNDENNKHTTHKEWSIANCNYVKVNDLLYMDFPTRWVWNKCRKCWNPRKR